MDWYADNRHEEVAMAIPGYIVGYCLFNYATPKPIRELFELYYQITEPAFFQALGFTNLYRQINNGSLNKRSLKRAFERIENANQATYADLKIDSGKIDLQTSDINSCTMI